MAFIDYRVRRGVIGVAFRIFFSLQTCNMTETVYLTHMIVAAIG